MPETKKKAALKKEEAVVELSSLKKKVNYDESEKLLELKHVKQYFRFKNSEVKYLKAVHDVSFDVYKGEVFGLVGESGCGKTTTGRDILRLYPITSGDIYMEGVRIAAGTRWNEKEIKWKTIRAKEDIKELEAQKYGLEPNSPELQRLDNQIEKIKADVERIKKEQMEKIRLAHYDNKHVNEHLSAHEIEKVNKEYSNHESEEYKAALAEAKRTTLSHKVQMIFQDPIASLNPRMTVRNIIAEGLIINGVKDKEYIDKEVERVLKLVGLVPEHATRYPHEFSGGQRQRIGIARAIIMKPELIVADEPVSALDVSVQAQVINLLNDLRNTLGLTIIFIAHNLIVVKYFCDRIAVMYYGNLVELASSDELFAHPLHPYTKSLLSAVPFPDPIVEKNRTRIIYNPMTDHDYSKQEPTYREIVPGHFVRCNDEEEKRYLEELKK
jgi:oligopeptide transport system ATP-binding protein